MLIYILVGVTALTLLSVGSAALLYAHLTGRLRKPVTLGVIATSIVLGGGLLAGRMADSDTFGHLSLPIGVFFLLEGMVAGFIVLCAGSARRSPRAREDAPELHSLI
jgi:hypothetical protein